MLLLSLLLGLARADEACLDVAQSADSCSSGEQVQLEAVVGSDCWDTGAALSFAWQQDTRLIQAGYNGVDTDGADAVTFTCPDCPPGEDGATYEIKLVATDATAQLDSASATITLHCSDPTPVDDVGCSSAPALPAALLLLLLPLIATRSHR